ncbi:MAG TPA: hypothetical protein VIJ20_01120, partial [Solirubrobacteraceae bacterium]
MTVIDSAEEFSARAGQLLASRVEHNILATVLESVRLQPGGSARFAYVENDRGLVVAAALRTPPRRVAALTPAPHQRPEVGHLALGELAHHLAHL